MLFGFGGSAFALANSRRSSKLLAYVEPVVAPLLGLVLRSVLFASEELYDFHTVFHLITYLSFSPDFRENPPYLYVQ